jgi:formylglycine-generating enzyme required for sulfatase activity
MSIRLITNATAVAALLVTLAAPSRAPAQVPFYTSTTPAQAAFDSTEAVRRQVETAAALGMPVADTIRLPGGVAMEMRLCVAGKFPLGSPTTEAGHEQDEALHQGVFAQPFYVSTYMLTQSQYRAIMDSLPHGTTAYRANFAARVSYFQMRDSLFPAMQAYAPTDWQFACVTSAQMEYATRAGTLTKWYTGEDEAVFATAAWYNANSGGQEHAVGLKKPNAWGFYDMLGNVWQWVTGFSSSYDNSPTTTHTVKSGDYNSEASGNGCRSANVMIQDVPSGVRVAMNCTRNLMTGVSGKSARMGSANEGMSVLQDRIVVRQRPGTLATMSFTTLDGKNIASRVQVGSPGRKVIMLSDLGLAPGSYMVSMRTQGGGAVSARFCISARR